MNGIAEAVVWIAVNDERRRILTCAPHDPIALALGHAVAEQWVDQVTRIVGAHERRGPGAAIGVELRVEEDALAAGLELQRHRVAHGCGLRHEIDCTPGSLRERRRHGSTLEPPPHERLSELFRSLFAVADAASPEGGVHAAALTDGETLVQADTDVARHCAVDRVIGRALAGGLRLNELGLLLSSRVSGAMALKAAHTGIAWVASRSLATSLALEIAEDAHMPVLQRAVRKARDA